MKNMHFSVLLPWLSSTMQGSNLICPDSINCSALSSHNEGAVGLKDVYNTLIKCSSVRTLDLRLAWASIDTPFNTGWNFDFQSEDNFPPLHQLYLKNYEFNEYTSIGLKDAQDRWDGFRLLIARYIGLHALSPRPKLPGRIVHAGANLIKWKAAMDWKELQDLELECIDPIFFTLMEGQLPALKSLRLGPQSCYPGLGENITKFVTQLSPLSRLSLKGHTNQVNLTRILDRHAAALQTLQIQEFGGVNYHKTTLSLKDLEQISQRCPSLSKISIDISWNGSWPLKVLDSLAASRNLSSLEISLELNLDPQIRRVRNGKSFSYEDEHPLFVQPSSGEISSLYIFKHLRSLKNGVELLHLTLDVGGGGRKYGFVSTFPLRKEAPLGTFKCSVLDSDGQRKSEGVPWCENVGRLRNCCIDYGPSNFDLIDDEDDDLATGGIEGSGW